MTSPKCLTLQQKLQVHLKVKKTPAIKNPMLAEWIHASFKITVSRATLTRLRNLPDSYFRHVNLSATKRRRVKFPEFERQLREFFFRNESKTAMADDILLMKARELAGSCGISDKQLRLSNGWLQSFKKRNGIRSHTLSGEGGSVEDGAVRDARLELQELIAGFDPENVFNFDETALSYRLAPNRTLATAPRKGKKQEKARLTLAFCCNATGSVKLNPVVIGTAKNLRCFKKGVTIKDKSISYYSSNKAWMTSVIFDDWLRQLNLKMAAQERKILLLVDNASSHKIQRELSHVIGHFLPPNMTSAVQPLDAGIIRSFKARYRKLFVRWCLDAVEADLTRKLNVLEAVQFSIEAWAGVTATTIKNCWIRTRICDGTMIGEVRNSGEYLDAIASEELAALSAMMKGLDVSVNASEYVAIDDEIDVHEPDAIVGEATVSDDDDKPEKEEDNTIAPTLALKHCMELSAYLLQCGGDTDHARNGLQAVMALVRASTVKAKRQRTMREFLV